MICRNGSWIRHSSFQDMVQLDWYTSSSASRIFICLAIFEQFLLAKDFTVGNGVLLKDVSTCENALFHSSSNPCLVRLMLHLVNSSGISYEPSCEFWFRLIVRMSEVRRTRINLLAARRLLRCAKSQSVKAISGIERGGGELKLIDTRWCVSGSFVSRLFSVGFPARHLKEETPMWLLTKTTALTLSVRMQGENAHTAGTLTCSSASLHSFNSFFAQYVQVEEAIPVCIRLRVEWPGSGAWRVGDLRQIVMAWTNQQLNNMWSAFRAIFTIFHGSVVGDEWRHHFWMGTRCWLLMT